MSEDEITECVFKQVKLPRGVDKLTQVTCGEGHGVGLTDDRLVITWGSPHDGRLGRPPAPKSTEASHKLPRVIKALSDKDVNQVFASSGHTVGLTETGEMWLWGTVGPELYPRPVKVTGDALADAAFIHGCATEWYTMCVAAVAGPGEARSIAIDR